MVEVPLSAYVDLTPAEGHEFFDKYACLGNRSYHPSFKLRRVEYMARGRKIATTRESPHPQTS